MSSARRRAYTSPGSREAGGAGGAVGALNVSGVLIWTRLPGPPLRAEGRPDAPPSRGRTSSFGLGFGERVTGTRSPHSRLRERGERLQDFRLEPAGAQPGRLADGRTLR